MTEAKRKISISLDTDLVTALEAEELSLSAQINAALRADLERRQRARLLEQLLDELDSLHGPVSERLVQKYTDLLA